MGDPLHLEARVTRKIFVSPELVFDAWLSPELIRKWFAPGMGEMVRVDVEARAGGKFSFVQRRGGEDVEHTGEYLMLERPTHLEFTWGVPKHSPDMSRVRITFTPVENGCEVSLVHELNPNWANYVSRTEGAWTKMLDAMAVAVEKRS
ncbi:MAG: ATPase [Verrucomicrobiales bacterium]|nr:ATPase [Verrucomicrobiales bacterium]